MLEMRTVLEFKGQFGWIDARNGLRKGPNGLFEEPFPAIEHPLATKHKGKIYARHLRL